MSKFTVLSLSALLAVMWQTSVFSLAGDTTGMGAASGTTVPSDGKDGAAGTHEPECE